MLTPLIIQMLGLRNASRSSNRHLHLVLEQYLTYLTVLKTNYIWYHKSVIKNI